jgi:hypothetical protein
VKTNKFRDVTCVKYATTSRVSLDRIRAPLGQVRFLPPREAPKRSAPPPLFEREARRPKTTIAILEERFEALKQQMNAMQANRDLQHMTMKNMMAQIETNTREIRRLRKEVEKLKNRPSEKKD